MTSYDEILSAAISDFERYGYDSTARLERWRKLLEGAALAQSKHNGIDAEDMKRRLKTIFSREVTNGGLFRRHAVSKFTIDKVKPALRRELERRMMASAQLIKLNREEMIAATSRRFSGWATSIPAGGSEAIEKRETAGEIKKALKQLPYTERRVMIDQGAKFTASLNDILATEGGAIAAIWHSRWRAAGYSGYRKAHKERDKKIYVLRGNWAMEKGLMKLGGRQYTDEITMVGEEINCSCVYEYLYSINDLPKEMQTDKFLKSEV